MDALITAGGTPNEDSYLYPLTQGLPKALLKINEKPLVQWIIDALNQSEFINNIVIVGLDNTEELISKKPITFVPNQGGMIANILAGTNKIVEISKSDDKFLIVSSDIPAITGEIVDWAVKSSLESDHDFFYNVVKKQTMLDRFPNANRTFIKLKGIEVCGGDMNVIKPWIVKDKEDLWENLAGTRKSFLKQAAIIGVDTLVLILLGRVNVDELARIGSKKLKMKCKGVISPYAELAMDIDKPEQYEILNQDLKKNK